MCVYVCVVFSPVGQGRDGRMKDDRRRKENPGRKGRDVLSQFRTRDPLRPNHGSRRFKPRKLGYGRALIGVVFLVVMQWL